VTTNYSAVATGLAMRRPPFAEKRKKGERGGRRGVATSDLMSASIVLKTKGREERGGIDASRIDQPPLTTSSSSAKKRREFPHLASRTGAGNLLSK